MSDTPHGLGAFVLDEAKKWLARTSIAGSIALILFLVTPLKDNIAAALRSPAQIAEISAKLDALTAEVQRATGEDRVIYEAPGLTYVREPVYQGDQITLNMVVRRTRLGAACALVNRTALFTDETNIASAGPTLRPARQMTTTEAPVRLVLDVPPQVRPGRVTVYLSLEFSCPQADGKSDKTIFDQTRPVAFMLLRKG